MAENSENTHWTNAQEETLLGVMSDAYTEGMQADNGWKPQVWERAVRALDGKKTVPQAKNRWQRVCSHTSTLLVCADIPPP